MRCSQLLVLLLCTGRWPGSNGAVALSPDNCENCCNVQSGYWDEAKEKFIPELVYVAPTTGPTSGGGYMLLIWKDMHPYMSLGPDLVPKINLVRATLDETASSSVINGKGTALRFRWVKQEEEVVDFVRYTFMEPEDNARLIERYKNSSRYVIIEAHSPKKAKYPYSAAFDMFLLTDGIYEHLKKPACWNGSLAHQIRPENYTCAMTPYELSHNDNAWQYYFHRQPVFKDVFPVSGPAQGGTLVSIMGEHFTVWNHERPIIKVVSASGIDQHIEPESVESQLITFYTPSQRVSSTGVVVPAQVYFSASGNRWYSVLPFVFKHYDNSRIHWGDAIAFSHLNWKQYTVHSESVAWRSGSHEQMVAAKPEVEADTNKFWIIKAGNGQPEQVSGKPVLCGSRIRLMHVRTRKYLHTYFHSSLASRQQQIYAFGHMGEGDIDDDWVIECEHNTRHGYSWKWKNITNRWHDLFQYDRHEQNVQIQAMLDENNIYWRPSTVFRLYHPQTQKYLTFPDVDVLPQSCASCSKTGLLKELTAVDYELGDSQRFFVKRQTRVPIPCSSTELLTKRWNIKEGPLRVGDFVLWRHKSDLPCIVTGPHPITGVQNEPDTRFGQVISVFNEARTVQIEEWKEHANIYSDAARYITQTPWKINTAFGRHNLHGPLVWKQIPCLDHDVFLHAELCPDGSATGCETTKWLLLNKTNSHYENVGPLLYENVGPLRLCVKVYIERIASYSKLTEQED